MRLIAATLVLALAAASAAGAASLRVSPVTIQLEAPASAARLTLANPGDDATQIQVRVFRWTQVDGEDRLERASGLVASPPATEIQGGGESLVRIIRVAESPVAREESYRVLVDQLPEPGVRRGASLDILMRYSIPVFVSPGDQAPPEIAWSATRAGDALILTATNTGGRRVKLTALGLDGDGAGAPIRQDGLVGYVLAGGLRSWSYKVPGGAFQPGTTLHISATGDNGDFSATTRIDPQ